MSTDRTRHVRAISRSTEKMAKRAGTVSLKEIAYEATRRMIISLQLPPGSPINEEELATNLGMGRTPLREALKRLEIEGLVAVYPRRGTFVTDINIESLGTLTELRAALEGLVAELAAQRRLADDIEVLCERRDELVRLSSAEPDEGYFDLFRDIHEDLYYFARNPYLAGTARTHYQLSYRIWHLFQQRLVPLRSHSGTYVKLIDAVIEGNGAAAREIASSHVLGFQQEVKSLL